jgi:cold shock CspA family protein
MKTGILRSWHSERGFGILSAKRNEAYFLHTNNVLEGPEEPAIGSLVEFDVAPADNNGKFPQAIRAKITPPDAKEPAAPTAPAANQEAQ